MAVSALQYEKDRQAEVIRAQQVSHHPLHFQSMYSAGAMRLAKSCTFSMWSTPRPPRVVPQS